MAHSFKHSLQKEILHRSSLAAFSSAGIPSAVARSSLSQRSLWVRKLFSLPNSKNIRKTNNSLYGLRVDGWSFIVVTIRPFFKRGGVEGIILIDATNCVACGFEVVWK